VDVWGYAIGEGVISEIEEIQTGERSSVSVNSLEDVDVSLLDLFFVFLDGMCTEFRVRYLIPETANNGFWG